MSAAVPVPETGSRCEFRTYHQIVRKDGEKMVKSVTDPFKAEDMRNDDDAYALVVERDYTNKEGDHGSVTLKVNSPHLLGAFKQIIKSYPGVSSDFSNPFQLSSPFQMLMHWWPELDAHRREGEDAVVRMHLNLLFEFLDFELGPARDKIMATVREGQITYLNAWVLFRPGDLVYAKVLGEPWLLRCQKTAYEVSTSKGPYLEVHCTFTDHDGTNIGEAKHIIVIFQKRQFGQENPAIIAELPVFPRQFVTGQDELEDKLIKRGEKFLAHMEVSPQEYDGIAHYLKEPPYLYWHPDMADFDGVWLPYTEAGRVILDRKTFYEDQYSRQATIKVVKPDPLLCPPYAVGYSLSRKDWCRFLVDKISPVRWKQSVWDSLVIPDRQKLILQGLVTSHKFPSNARNQPEQKGKGLVILLHGTPGSGKTLSAETAAEGTKKALVSTSLGQLNRDNIPWAFEWRLKQLFQYATTWKAVVLLDEADVFLAARDLGGGGDKKHNSMVAIFLRELEYFSGIVFLTTNILLSFDEAIRSRIHLALGFDPPGRDIRSRIWTQCLRQIPADEVDLLVSTSTSINDDAGDSAFGDAIRRLVPHELNGREISNAVNTARTTAKFQGVKLNLGHIEDVLEVRKAFDKRIKDETRSLKKKSVGPSGRASFGPGALLRQNSIVSAEPEEYVDE